MASRRPSDRETLIAYHAGETAGKENLATFAAAKIREFLPLLGRLVYQPHR